MRRTLAILLLTGAAALPGCVIDARSGGYEDFEGSLSDRENRELVRAAFERWRSGTGGPFELLADDAEWTIVGSSPFSRTYSSKKQFIGEVITPFNARLSRPLVPTVRGIYADRDTVIVFFDGEATANDGLPYRNTYTWFLEMRDARVVRATAFFDTRLFDEFWTRVPPSP